MTIMHSAMLEFGRALFTTVRATLNYDSYTEIGADIFKRTHEKVLKNSELLKFKSGIMNIDHSSTQPPTEESVFKTVYTTLATK